MSTADLRIGIVAISYSDAQHYADLRSISLGSWYLIRVDRVEPPPSTIVFTRLGVTARARKHPNADTACRDARLYLIDDRPPPETGFAWLYGSNRRPRTQGAA